VLRPRGRRTQNTLKRDIGRVNRGIKNSCGNRNLSKGKPTLVMRFEEENRSKQKKKIGDYEKKPTQLIHTYEEV